MNNPLLHAGAVYELRAPKTRQGTVSGYFDDPNILYDCAMELDGKVNIYASLNPVTPALLARAKNRLQTHAKATTSDHDIVRRDWLLIDCDAVRPSDISASDAEHEAALARADAVRAWFTEQGWPEPVVADSGNGGHLDYRVDLPNDADSTTLIKSCLEVLALKFDDGAVKIDTSVFNAARICKLYGTFSCKGDSTEDRPHRRSQILSVPPDITPVPIDLLRQLASLRPVDPKPNFQYRNGPAIEAKDFITRHGLSITREKPWNGATVFELDACPFNAEHLRSSSIIQFPTGALAFTCFHNSCQGLHWQELRDLLEPGRTTRPSGNGPAPAEAASADGADVVQLSTVKPELIRWLWRRRLAYGKLNLIIGDPGLGKSYFTIDMAARVTTGRPWPDGTPCPQGSVVILSAEDGIADTIRPRLDRLGGDPECVFVLKAIRQQGQLRPFCMGKDFPALEQVIRDTHAVAVSIDPLSAYLGRIDSSVDGEVRGLLTPLADLADRTGVMVLGIMHMTKNAQVKAIYRAPGSIGFIGAARMALAVVQDPHEEDRRILAPVKVNICNPPPMLGFSISEDGLFWDTDPVEHVDVDAILRAANDQEDRPSKTEVVDWLREALRDGPQPAHVLTERAAGLGFSDRALRHACDALRVVKQKAGFHEGGWQWALPTDEPAAAPSTKKDAWTPSEEKPSNPLKNAKASEDVQGQQMNAFEASEDVQTGQVNAFGTSSHISTTYDVSTHEGVQSQRIERDQASSPPHAPHLDVSSRPGPMWKDVTFDTATRQYIRIPRPDPDGEAGEVIDLAD